jgi:preprotein translocase subunit SecA
MAGIFKKLFGDDNTRTVKAIQPIILEINKFETEVSVLSPGEIKEKTNELKARIAKGETLDSVLPYAYALVREAAKRTLGQRHFDVQLIGGVIMHRGGIAEMRTGEGKTLVATLPAYLNALSGKGVHVITVNDYLARRDASWMGQVYDALGLSVGIIAHDESSLYDKTAGVSKEEEEKLDAERDEKGSFKVEREFLRPVSRKEAYGADITYGTNSEFGFDYLRDNLSYIKEDVRQRGWNCAIVDEIDSILIDEARTPLIISAPTREGESLYQMFASIVEGLREGDHYTVDEKHKTIMLTDAGIGEAEKKLGVGNIYTDRGVRYVHHLETAVRAKALFKLDKNYVVRDNQIIIVDEFTGRMQPGRRWSEGLHQAIEAKEGVMIQQETRTYASITYQNYFRQYGKLAGMTGTALTSSEEFFKVYRLNTVSIPTNKPIARKDGNDLIFQTEKGKWQAIARKVKELNEKGQPVLIGTVSIERNELLSAYLKREGVRHEVLNAKNHEREAEIIAQAGRFGAVTIATNMAGRGVDIKLGGIPVVSEEAEKVRNVGGLFVLGTERHDARRIDNQLRGRAGRQGDPGETQFFVSLEDDLMRVFASDTLKRMMGRFGIPEDQPIENGIVTKSLETAQSRIEGFNFDARKHVLEFDDVMNLHRKTVYERRRKMLFASSDEVLAELNSIIDLNDAEFVKGLKDKEEKIGRDNFAQLVRSMFLQTIDMFWVDHLDMMDHLRSSVNLRAYGQHDPLVEYKREGTILFKGLMANVDANVISMITSIDAVASQNQNRAMQEAEDSARVITGEGSSSVRTGSVVLGRNERVIVVKGTEEKEIKWKKVSEYEKDGWKIKG